MTQTRINRRPVITVILVLVVMAAGIGILLHQSSLNNTTALTASGTVETTQVSVAPEVAGKVLSVNVQEGDSVKAGDTLLTLDGTILQAQQSVAAAGLDTARAAALTADAALASAQTQVDLAINAALVTDKGKRTSQWVANAPSDFNLPLWYYSQAEQMSAAQSAVDAAQAALTDTQNNLAAVETSASTGDFVLAEKNLAAAQASYTVANDLNNRVQNGKNIDDLTRRQLFLVALDAQHQNSGSNSYWLAASNIDQYIKDSAQKQFDDAKSNLKDAQAAYEKAVSNSGAKDVLNARALVSLAQERYNTALDYVSFQRTGSGAPSVTVAQEGLGQTKAADDQAHIAVAQAQANLNLLNAQIGKLTISAPSQGVVLARAVEPGESVSPGAQLLTLGRLDQLTMTVYVPENRLGQVYIGQSANVVFDSFSGQTFRASVLYISNQAEFTPRNVQTVDGRQTTVFAVKLQLPDTNSQLKPGMPGDVTFVLK
jgi:HlyD family secretion protein